MRRFQLFSGLVRNSLGEIDEEFAQHIEERTQMLCDQGWERAAAERESRRRFGNVDQWRLEAAATMVGSRLGPRIAASVLIAVIASASLTAAGFTWVLTSRSAAANDRLGAEVSSLRRDLAPFTGEAESIQAIPLAQDLRFVTIRGKVAKPYVWAIPRDLEVPIESLLAKSGGLLPDATGELVIRDRATQAGQEAVRVCSIAELRKGDSASKQAKGFVTVDVH